jgi:hypothetical protein
VDTPTPMRITNEKQENERFRRHVVARHLSRDDLLDLSRPIILSITFKNKHEPASKEQTSKGSTISTVNS